MNRTARSLETACAAAVSEKNEKTTSSCAGMGAVYSWDEISLEPLALLSLEG